MEFTTSTVNRMLPVSEIASDCLKLAEPHSQTSLGLPHVSHFANPVSPRRLSREIQVQNDALPEKGSIKMAALCQKSTVISLKLRWASLLGDR